MEKLKSNRLKMFLNSADKTPHYGLRKLGVGVASVLLSTTLFMGAQSNEVHADTQDGGQDTSNADVAVDKSSIDLPTQDASSANSAQVQQAAPSSAQTETAQVTNSAPTVQAQPQNNQNQSAPVTSQTPQANQQVQAPVQSNVQNQQAQVQQAVPSSAQTETAQVANSEPTVQAQPQNNQNQSAPVTSQTPQANQQVQAPVQNNVQNQQEDVNNYQIASQTPIQNNNAQTNTQIANNSISQNAVNDSTQNIAQDVETTVSRTVNYQADDGISVPKTHVDTFTFNGTQTTDAQGQTVTNYNQKSHEFEELNVPTVSGAIASQKKIPRTLITPESQDLIYTINYSKDTLKNTDADNKQYVRQTQTENTLNKPIEAQTSVNSDHDIERDNINDTENEADNGLVKNHAVDEKANYTTFNPQVYKMSSKLNALASPYALFTSFVATDNNIDPSYTQITPDNPIGPDGVNRLNDLKKETVRTIKYWYVNPNGTKSSAGTHTDTATFYRVALYKDGKFESYTPWKEYDSQGQPTGEDVSLTFPIIKTTSVVNLNGKWHADRDQVDAKVVHPGDQSWTENVNLTPENGAAIIRYLDADSTNNQNDHDSMTVLGEKALSGQDEEAIDYDPSNDLKYWTSRGYEVMDNPLGDTDTSFPIYYDSSKVVTVDILLNHGTEQVNDPNPLKITRTINYVTKDGKQAATPAVDTVTFNRTGTKDKVTGKITYPDWGDQTQNINRRDSPQINGYIPDKAYIDSKSVTPKMQSWTETVTYSPETSDTDETKTVTRTIVYHVPSGSKQPDNVVQHVTIKRTKHHNNKTGEDTYGDWVPGTYDSVNNPVIPGTHTTSKTVPSEPASEDKTVDVTYLPNGHIVPVDPDGNKIPNAPTPTIETDPGDPTKAKPDEKVPDVPTYTPQTPTVTPTDPGKDTPAVYTHNKADMGLTVRFIDQDNNNAVLKTVPQSGKEGDKIAYDPKGDITAYESQGYELVKNDVPTGQTFNGNNNGKTFDVTLKHAVKGVTGDIPNPSPNPDAKGKKMTELGMDKDAIIDYKYDDSNGANSGKTMRDDNGKEIPDHHQKIHFVRDGKVDMVTGKVTPTGDWVQQDQINRIIVPVKGYDARWGDSTSTDKEIHMHVLYKKQLDQMGITVRFIDQDNNNAVLSTKSVKGEEKSNIDYDAKDDIQHYIDNGYELANNGYNVNGQAFSKDNNGKTYDITFKHGTVTVTPDKPGSPGGPINPNGDENSAKWPNGTDANSLTKTGSQIIHYTGAGSDTPQDNVQNTTFEHSVVVDKTNGKIIKDNGYTPSNHKFDTVKTPVINGYHVSKDNVNVGGFESTPDNPTKTYTVNYSKNGKIVPVGPDGKPIPNAPTKDIVTDPNDPSKAVPDEPVPDVPGYTPETPTVTPTDPGKDTHVVYKADVGLTIRFIDQDNNNAVLKSVPQKGKVGDNISYNPQSDITTFEDKGYELVSNGAPKGTITSEMNGKTFDIVLKHGTASVTPNKPGKPGEPINPKDPNGPKWPAGTDANSLTKTGKQTIHYTGAGNNTPKDSVETTTFNHNLIIDKTNGKIIKDNGYTPSSHKFDTVKTPVVNGYHVSSDEVNVGGFESTPDNPEKTYTVNYVANGKITPVDPNGKPIPNVPTPQYQNDPNDPSKVIPTPVPHIPHYNPDTPNVTPKDPGKDTPVVYNPENNKSHIVFVDDDEGGKEIDHITENVKYGDDIPYPQNKIDELTKKGYDFKGSDLKPNTKSNGDSSYTIHFTHKTEDINPETKVTQVIHYVDENGNKIADDNVQTLTFKHPGKTDLVTGKITYDDNADSWKNPQSTTKVVDPQIDGYELDEDTDNVPANSYTHDSNPKPITVKYKATKQAVTIIFADDITNETILKRNFKGKTGDSTNYTTQKDIEDLIKKHYKVINDETHGKQLSYGKKDTSYVVYLGHDTKDTTRSRTITRTIHYVVPNGKTAPKDVVQTLTFTDHGKVDLVTGKTTWDSDVNPITKGFDKVDSPNVDGTTPNYKTVDGENISLNSKNWNQEPNKTVVVTYVANNDNNNNGDDDNGKKDNGDKGDYPLAPIKKDKAKDNGNRGNGNNNGGNGKHNNGNNTGNGGAGQNANNGGSGNGNNGNIANNGNNNGNNNANQNANSNNNNASNNGNNNAGNGAGNHVAQAATMNNNAKAKALPQTGEANNLSSLAVGALLIGMSGVLGIGLHESKRKRHN